MKAPAVFLLFLVSLSAQAQWTYRTTEDKMRQTNTKYAELRSTNRAQLDFPYRGGSTLQLILRKRSEDDLDVILWLNKGQVPCHDRCVVTAKFDDDDPLEFFAVGPQSASSDSLFLYEEQAIVDRLKTAKKLIVEVLIYDHGKFQFTFSPRGLKWQ